MANRERLYDSFYKPKLRWERKANRENLEGKGKKANCEKRIAKSESRKANWEKRIAKSKDLQRFRTACLGRAVWSEGTIVQRIGDSRAVILISYIITMSSLLCSPLQKQFFLLMNITNKFLKSNHKSLPYICFHRSESFSFFLFFDFLWIKGFFTKSSTYSSEGQWNVFT